MMVVKITSFQMTLSWHDWKLTFFLQAYWKVRVKYLESMSEVMIGGEGGQTFGG